MRNRFFIQIVIVAIASMLFSTLYFYGICSGLRKTKESFPGKLNQILYDSSHYDAVFVGTSRVLKNIDPLQFDSLTGLHSYNAGIDGANLTLINVVLKHFIRVHRSPQYVFINLDTYTMEGDSTFFYFPQLFPHMQTEDIQPLIYTEAKLSLSKYYPFIAISYIDDYLKGVAFHTLTDRCPECDSTFIRRGFAPIRSMDYHGDEYKYSPKFVCDPQGFKKLESLCSFCTEHHCKVFFIMAPIYMSVLDSLGNSAEFYSMLDPIKIKYNIGELNFLTDTRFKKNLFFNRTHLNEAGARLYTKILADSVNKITGISISQISSLAPQESADH